MNPNQSLKKLRIFAASPSDVATERAKLETVVGLLKPLADHIGITIEVVDWRKVVPDMGRPQQLILDQLQPTTWDVFIGILWHRFGTPPGGKDPQTQKEYLSGTEEEFKSAFRLWEQFQKPRIMMYRCTRQVDLDKLDPDQFKRVKEFFAQFDAIKGEHPGLYQTFDSTEAFEKLLLDNLQKLLLEYSEKEKGRAVSPQEIQVLAPQPPDNLPRRAAFFGRTQEMETVLQALSPEERGWGVVIDGIGGIGKTALAVEAAYRCKEAGRFEAFIFVSAKQKRLEPSGIKEQSPVAATLDEFVNETARVLGQIGIAKLTGEDKRRALLEALRSKRGLLIYDNLETLTKEEQEALADFLRFLPQGCKAILTSRRRGGEGALWLRLEQLTWETAREIIRHEAGREARLAETMRRVGESRWRELFNETGGSPLALIWTLGLMRAKALSFDRALEMLRHGANLESPLQEFIYQEARKELGAQEVAALNALSFFVPSASFEALMNVANLTRTALEIVLERLNALALVDILPGEERYSLHPLTRGYVRAELLVDAAVEHSTGMRFARYWVEYAKRYGGEEKESYKTYDRLEAEWPNLQATANYLWEIAGMKNEIVGDKKAVKLMNDLADALRQFLWFGGRWDEHIQLSTWAHEAACIAKDWSKAGWRTYEVAWIYYNRDRLDDAALWTDHCAAAWSRGGSKHKQATVMWLQGLIARERQNYDEAEKHLRDALVIWRALVYNLTVAIVLNDLGELARQRGDYDTAEKYYREALAVAQKIDDKGGQATYIGSLALIALDRQQWAEARQWFEQALPLAREVGRVDVIASAQHGLARVWEKEDRPDLALPLAQEALAIRERLQHRDLAVTRELVQRLTAAVEKSAT
jgi:tetratricopeptide (TPR) repeat protein